MTPTHHPEDETLFRQAAGSLSAGPRLVVATHLEVCARCRGRLRGFEAVGGALLEALPATDISRSLLTRTLARLDASPTASAAIEVPSPPGLGDVPAPLRRYPIGRWRYVQPGFHFSRISIPEDRRANVMLLKVAAGRSVPQHGHDGVEYTQVLSGSFSDALGHYGPGDLIEADDDIDHQPIVGEDGECICLAAVEGRLRLHSFVARLVQPFLGL